MFRQQSGRLKGLSFNKMIPNILTMLALGAGMMAIRFGLEEKWDAALISLAIAAILDSLDGRIARALRGTSSLAPNSIAFQTLSALVSRRLSYSISGQ